MSDEYNMIQYESEYMDVALGHLTSLIKTYVMRARRMHYSFLYIM